MLKNFQSRRDVKVSLSDHVQNGNVERFEAPMKINRVHNNTNHLLEEQIEYLSHRLSTVVSNTNTVCTTISTTVVNYRSNL